MVRLIAVSLLLTALPALGQVPDFGKDAQLAEMKKLEWLVGEWAGSSTMQFGPNQSASAQVVERVEKRLDGLAMQIEGVGKAMVDGQERKVHHALAMVRYDLGGKLYRFAAQTFHGSFVDAEARVVDQALVWGFKSAQGEYRYTIRQNSQGQWVEIGEISTDGKSWRRFFEMTLDRVK